MVQSSVRLRREFAVSFLVAFFLLALASFSAAADADSDARAAVDSINAAIKAKGAKWIAAPTEPMMLPAGNLCGLDAKGEQFSPDSGGITTSAVELADDPLPAFFDWRNKDGHDWTTRIQDQGGCGSCYIFAACAASEGAMKVQAGPGGWQASPDFSEQFIMSCLIGGGTACGGGSVWPIYNMLINEGAPPDTCFPYTANDDQPCSDRCTDWQSQLMHIAGYAKVAGTDFATIEQTKRAIMTYGPVSTGFDVYTDFMSYSGGVYTYTSGVLEGGHAVAIVGWDDSQQCWIAKNSWGTNWGETKDFQPFTWGAGDGGWFRIKWNENWFGTCTKYALASLPNLTDITPSGWTSSLVARNTTGATPTSCTVTSTLPGESMSTYANYSVKNTGSVAAPAFSIATLADGEEVTRSYGSGLAGGSVLSINNYGPFAVRGGRHTLSVLIDADNTVPETDETTTVTPFDNVVHRQYVWSPRFVAANTSLPREAPPVRDAWGDAPSPRYDNCDGFSFGSDNAYWSVVGLISSSTAGLYDLKLWGVGDYQNSTTGFGPNWIQHSQAAGTLCDFVVINGRKAPYGTYYAGVINTNAGAADYRIEHKRAVPMYTRPGTTWNGPYSKLAHNVLDVYDVYLQAGEYGFNLDQMEGDCPLGFALYNKAGNTFSKDGHMPGASHDSINAGDRYFTVNIPEQGVYGLVVYKRSSTGWEKPTTYRIAAARKSIYVVTPNGGEVLGLGEVYPITWENFGTQGSTVNIQISRDGGFSWSTIVDNAANMGVYNWTVSGKATQYGKIRIESNGGNYADNSDANFSIISRDITVTSPAGGESWPFNSAQSITWSSYGVTGNVKIELSRNSGSTWETIAESTPDDGSYTWTAALPSSEHCRVRISSVDVPTCFDTSDADFTIAGPTVQVTSPNGGEVWAVGDQETITWSSQNFTTPVAIDISRNNGSSWANLVSSTPNDGSHDWAVAGTAATQCRVRVRSVDYAEASDTSDAAFTIAERSITLTSPYPYQQLVIGSTVTVAWSGQLLEGPVKIEISRDNRATWTTLTETAATGPTGGQESFPVTGPPASSVYFRVTCVDYPSLSDTNDNLVRITGMWVDILNPNGGETVFYGDRYGIYWSMSEVTGLCEVQLSTDSGATWQTLVSNYNIQNCYYAWNVGDVNSSTCRIRVISLEYPELSGMSDADFTVGRRTITVTSPVGGETWCVGSTREILWTSSNVEGNVNITLRAPGGSSTTIASNIENTGSYEWTVQLMTDPEYTVVVRSFSSTLISGESSGPVTIADSAITVLSPDGGEEFTIGASVPITWDSCNVPAGNVMIELSRDGGATWTTLFADTPNDGAENWTSTAPASAACRVRVTSLADPGISDTSNADFSLVSRGIRVDSPNGGEAWETGTTQYIRWTRTNCPGNVKIELTRNNRITWETIAASTSAEGEYPWVVTAPLTSQALIRVTSLSYPTVGDSSNALFNITDRGITVLTPEPGAGLTLGVPTAITWTSRNLHGDVKIELSRDAGSTWETLFASVLNTGSQSWTPSGKASGRCLIRITLLTYPAISDVTDGLFSLAARSIQVDSPAGGEMWGIGWTNTITWHSSNITGTVKIELTRDGWATSEVLAAATDDDGEFEWIVTMPPSSNCRVRVSANSHPGVSGESAAAFSIVEPVAVPLKVTLEDWVPGPEGMSADVQVLDTATGSVLEEHTVTLGATGSTSFDTALIGTRDIRVKASHWLSSLKEDVQIAQGMVGVLISLKNGDCNGDNAVNASDFDALKPFWGTKNPSDANADLNGDTFCDVFDLEILRKNWSASGDGGVALAGPSGATMWLGDARGRLLTEIVRVAGDPFDIYVWAATTVPTWFLNASVGFDRTLGTGTGASPMLRRIVLANGDPASDLAWCDATAAYRDDLGIRLGGLYSDMIGFRPYGADFACASMGRDVAPFTAMKVARLTLAHRLNPGSSAGVTLWNDGSRTGGFWQSMLMGTSLMHMDSQTVQIVSYVATSIPQAKAGPDGDPASIAGAAVTEAYPGFFYIETDDRSMGLRVEMAGHGAVAGSRADVSGTMDTNAHGERVLMASSVTVSGTNTLVPLGVRGFYLGGADWQYNPATGAGQQGVTGSHGVNSVGLLVRAWGRVTAVDQSAWPAWFLIDDGSGRTVKCVAVGGSPVVNPAWVGQFAAVTGIASCELQGGSVVPTILLRANAAPIVH